MLLLDASKEDFPGLRYSNFIDLFLIDVEWEHCDQIGQFLTALGRKIWYKNDQLLGNFWVNLKNINLPFTNCQLLSIFGFFFIS